MTLGPEETPPYAESAYLDIETSWSGRVTVVGIHRPGLDARQWVRPDITREGLIEGLEGVRRIVTYNGSRFDLPVIHRELALDLACRFEHVDLMYACWKRGLKGGLKGVERTLGIHRETEGVDGMAALRLWDAHRQGSKDALELLLRYNKEDVVNLETLERKLATIPVLSTAERRKRRKIARDEAAESRRGLESVDPF